MLHGDVQEARPPGFGEGVSDDLGTTELRLAVPSEVSAGGATLVIGDTELPVTVRRKPAPKWR